jgi:hypothetical protein
MTALAAVLGIVLYVVFHAEQRGISILWVGLPVLVAYLGAPLSGPRKARCAPVAVPALAGPIVVATAVFFTNPGGAGSPIRAWDLVRQITGSDAHETAVLDALQSLRENPATASRVRACETLIAPVKSSVGSVEPERLYECATAGR